MRKEDIIKPAELLQQINKIHRTTFALAEKYTQGEQGAFAIVDSSGKQYVLKWRPDLEHASQVQYVREVTDHLRTKGYPAPEYVWFGYALGGTYFVQTTLPGTPMRFLTESLLSQLIALNELQVGQAPPGPRDWPQEVVNTILFGGQGYCLHTSLQQHSPETAALLHQLHQLALRHQNDIVHFDFQPSNLLTAVIGPWLSSRGCMDSSLPGVCPLWSALRKHGRSTFLEFILVVSLLVCQILERD